MGDKQSGKWELVEKEYPGISADKLALMEKGQMLEFLGFIMNTYRFNEEEKNIAIGHLTSSNVANDNAAFLYTLATGAKIKDMGLTGNSPIRKKIFQHLDSIDTAAAYLAWKPKKGGKKYRKKRTKRRTRVKSRSKSRCKSKRRKRRKSKRRK